MLGKYLSAFGGTLILFLTGGAVMLSPWLLRFINSNGSWNPATTTFFWTGLTVVAGAASAFVFCYSSLRQELVELGLIAQRRSVSKFSVQPAMPSASDPTVPDDLMLITLASSLLAELKQEQAIRQGEQIVAGGES